MFSRLSRDSIWLLLSRLGTQAGLALFTILLARGLGTAAFGEYAFMASVIFIGNVVTTFGSDMLLIREIAATGSLAGLSSALCIQLVLSAAFIGLVTFFTRTFPGADPGPSAALRTYSLSMVPLAFYTVFTTALRGRQHMRAYAALSFAATVLQLAAAAWFLANSGELTSLAAVLVWAQVAAALLSAGLCAFTIKDFGQLWQSPFGKFLALLRACAPIALLGVLGVVYQRLALLMLPALAGSSATGWYSAAAKLVEAAKIGHVAVFTALYPAMAQYRSDSQVGWARGFRTPYLILMTGALLASVLLVVLAAILVPALFGNHYSASVPLVRIMAWSLVPYALNSFLTLALLARGEERSVVVALAMSIVLLGLLTAWWVPAFGILGAAYAILFAETAQAVVLMWLDSRRLGILGGLLSRQTLTDAARR